MPNSRPDVMTNDTAAIATLNIRTTALEGRVNELTNAINGVQTALASKIDSIASTLGSKIEERGRTPWAVYISGLAVVFSLYAYIDNSKIGPLKEKDTDLAAMMKEIAHTVRSEVIPQAIIQREWGQRDERFRQTDERIKFGEGAIVDRIKRLEDQFNSTWSQRDALTGFQERIQHLEQMLVRKANGGAQ